MKLWLLLVIHVIHLVKCESVVNRNVTRQISLTNLITRVKHEIIAEHVSSSYVFTIHPSEASQLAHITAHMTSQPNKHLKVSSGGEQGLFMVEFGVNSQSVQHFTVVCVFTEQVRPRPNMRLQGEPQYVKYSGNVLFYSPYVTQHQETTVKLAGENILDYSKSPKPVTKSSSRLTYGPYYEQAPLSHLTLEVHYEYNRPVLVVNELTRLIEISHWGNIAVEESLEIVNDGAKLNGPFSRLDFDNGIGRKTAVDSFTTVLPAAAKDVYYRDQIGNISTSQVSDLSDSIEVKISPRFPIMGGWKTEYILGYNVPAYQFLYRTGSQFRLQMRFLDHIYDNQYIRSMTVKVVLPELVGDVQVDLPFSVKQQSREVMKTYLDTVGRTVLVFKMDNLVSEHIVDFTVNYRFNPLLMLREPLMLTTGFLCIFMFAIIYVRLDFSIYKDEKNELQMRVQSLVDQTLKVCRKRCAIYEAYEETIRRFKLSKDANAFMADRRRLEAEQKQINQAVTASASAMADVYPNGVDKIRELTTFDQKYRDLIQQSIQQAERVVNGKMTKADYQAADSEMSSLKADLATRMETVMDSL